MVKGWFRNLVVVEGPTTWPFCSLCCAIVRCWTAGASVAPSRRGRGRPRPRPEPAWPLPARNRRGGGPSLTPPYGTVLEFRQPRDYTARALETNLPVAAPGGDGAAARRLGGHPEERANVSPTRVYAPAEAGGQALCRGPGPLDPRHARDILVDFNLTGHVRADPGGDRAVWPRGALVPSRAPARPVRPHQLPMAWSVRAGWLGRAEEVTRGRASPDREATPRGTPAGSSRSANVPFRRHGRQR